MGQALGSKLDGVAKSRAQLLNVGFGAQSRHEPMPAGEHDPVLSRKYRGAPNGVVDVGDEQGRRSVLDASGVLRSTICLGDRNDDRDLNGWRVCAKLCTIFT